MPSPRFWKTCCSSVNGAWPTQVAPSPPMWVISVLVLRSHARSPCRGSRCRPSPSTAVGHAWSRCCAGSRSRNTACARPCPAARCSSCSWPSRRARRCAQLVRFAGMLRSAGRRSPWRRRSASARLRSAGGCGRSSSALPMTQRAAVGRRVVEHARPSWSSRLRALLLDDDDLLQALGEAPRAFRLERPDHADLVEADAERPARASSMPRSSSAWRMSR